jgi:hypothetical protein
MAEHAPFSAGRGAWGAVSGDAPPATGKATEEEG